MSNDKLVLPKHFGHFINGKFVESISKKTFKVVNPSTEKVICEVSEGFEEDIEEAVKAAEKALQNWKNMTPTQRQKIMFKAADIIEREAKNLGYLESYNNGSPYAVSEGIAFGVAEDFRYYASWAGKIDGKVISVDSKDFVHTIREPYGVCGIIIPWNVPLWALAIKLCPCIAMGNVCVIKPSEKTPLTALRIAEILVEAGLPEGVVNIVNGFGPTAGKAIACHMKIRKLAFTGSTAVGKLLLEYSAKTNLKKVQLELGGKSPIVIDKEVDLDSAATVATISIFSNNGQLCTAGSRCLVHEDIHDEFLKKVIETTKKFKVGSPFDSQIGPIVDDIQFKRVSSYIQKGLDEGAHLQYGGKRDGDVGYFIQPTIFSDVKEDMTIYKEEIFGPVMSIIKYKTLDEAIEKCNKTEYGLAAAICSKNLENIFHFQRNIQAGVVWVNTYHAVYRNAEFGGFKQSGTGKDGGFEGVNDWTVAKQIVMKVTK